MTPLKVLVLMHKDLIPPEKFDSELLESANWRTEYEVMKVLKKMGHQVEALGVLSDLEPIRKGLDAFKPNIVFNLLEEFDSNPTWDQHVVSYLELKKVPYTGCNPRGLTLARDKALSKKILSFHRIPVPKFQVFQKNQKIVLHKGLSYPLIVKSLIEEASMGISQASVVKDFESLKERIEFIHQNLDTDAIVEQFIKGRELYVGILGNKRLKMLPVWELNLDDLPDSANKIATETVKWNKKYREKYKIGSKPAKGLSEDDAHRIQSMCKKAYQALGLSGYARIDIRYTDDGKIYILEANPNPGIAKDEEFSISAKKADLSYEDVMSKILSLGLSWYQSRK